MSIAKQFLQEKGMIKPGFDKFIINNKEGVEIVLNDLLEEYHRRQNNENFIIINGELIDLKHVYRITEVDESTFGGCIHSVSFTIHFLNQKYLVFQRSQPVHANPNEDNIKLGLQIKEALQEVRGQVCKQWSKAIQLNITTITYT